MNEPVVTVTVRCQMKVSFNIQTDVEVQLPPGPWKRPQLAEALALATHKTELQHPGYDEYFLIIYEIIPR